MSKSSKADTGCGKSLYQKRPPQDVEISQDYRADRWNRI
nr:MAG TPA: Flavivirus DEAD domain [Caudoviricetes sp.]